MGKLNGITPSEKLTLMLDGELDPGQEQELMSEIESNPDLQEEMDQLISIREALVRDTEAFTPPAAVTSSIFSSIGYMAPATAGSAATSAVTPLVQSLLMPVITALLISGGTLIFTSSDLDGLFVDNNSEPIAEQMTEFSDMLDKPGLNSREELQTRDISENVPVTSSRTVLATGENLSSERSLSAADITSNIASPTDTGTSFESLSAEDNTSQSIANLPTEDIDLLSRNSQSNFEETLALDNQIRIRSSGIIIPYMVDASSVLISNPNLISLPYNASSAYQMGADHVDKTNLTVFSVGGSQQIGADVTVLDLGMNIGGGFTFYILSDITDLNTGIADNEPMAGGFLDHQMTYLSMDISDNIVIYPSVKTDIATFRNLVVWGNTGTVNLEIGDFLGGIGYRVNSSVHEFGEYQLDPNSLPSNFVVSFGYRF